MPIINGRACVANGRNLLRNSIGKFQPNKSTTDNYVIYKDSVVYMTQGQQYTVHADASSGLVWSGTHDPSVENNRVVLRLVTGTQNVSTIISDANTGTGTTFTWNAPSGTYYFRVNTYKSDNSGYVENVKIEKGSVATPLTPAPVDKVFSNGKQVYGRNLIVQSDLKGGFVERDAGSIAYDVRSNFHSDNYIATNGATVFTFSSPDYVFKGSGNHTLAMYDSDKNYLGWQSITSATQTLSKSNVAYIRFSINFADEGGTFNYLSDWLDNHRYKLEKGSVATPWSPAPEDVM